MFWVWYLNRRYGRKLSKLLSEKVVSTLVYMTM